MNTLPVFETLYRSEAPKLLRYFRRRVGRDEAEDLVQECFIRLLRITETKSLDIEVPELYLRAIAKNLLRNLALRARRRCTALHVCSDDVSLLAGDQNSHLEARDILSRIDVIVAKFDALNRAIYIAQRVEGRSYKEIADRTGLSVKALERRLSNAAFRISRGIKYASY